MRHGQVLRPAILWNDQRTQAQCDEIHRRIGRARFIQITGNVALTGFTAPKILWVQQNEPDVYAKAQHVLLPKDYIRYRLTGEYAMDKADGAGTVLFDLKQRTWSAEVLAALGIPPGWMPPTFEGPQFTGQITAEAAAATGLKAGTPVAAGGGDQAAQAVGVGAVEPGVVALTVGTSGVVFATTPSALVEPEGRLHAFCHAVPGMWHFMGVMLSAAGSLQWYRDTLAPGMSFDDLLQEAEPVPAGSEGLQFLPYLSGERTPYPGSAGTRRLGGPHPAAWTRPHDPRPAGRRFLRPEGYLHPDPECRAGRDPPGARLRRRHEGRPVAADPGLCPGGRTGDGQYHRGGGLRRGPAGGRGRGRLGKMFRRPALRLSRSPAAPVPTRPRWKPTGKPIRCIANSTRRLNRALIK